MGDADIRDAINLAGNVLVDKFELLKRVAEITIAFVYRCIRTLESMLPLSMALLVECFGFVLHCCRLGFWTID